MSFAPDRKEAVPCRVRPERKEDVVQVRVSDPKKTRE